MRSEPRTLSQTLNRLSQIFSGAIINRVPAQPLIKTPNTLSKLSYGKKGYEVTTHLPTLTASSWTITALRDSLVDLLANDRRGQELRMFLYGVTDAGWRDIRKTFKSWLSVKGNRKVVAYVGTDHAITDAEAIRSMMDDGVAVRLMTTYNGIFHPKVFWLNAPQSNTIWIGSNNLTLDGLRNNIEFAALLMSRGIPRDLQRWASAVHLGSQECSEELLKSYKTERNAYGVRRVALGTFTWSRREKDRHRRATKRGRRTQQRDRAPTATRGNLILEIMPRETGQDGKQIQLPIPALRFFGLRDRVGSSRSIILSPSWRRDPRTLTMTVFKNHTARLVIRELDYRDRPCFLLFKRGTNGAFSFDIVSRSVFPTAYRDLIDTCGVRTREGSRRWCIVE